MINYHFYYFYFCFISEISTICFDLFFSFLRYNNIFISRNPCLGKPDDDVLFEIVKNLTAYILLFLQRNTLPLIQKY